MQLIQVSAPLRSVAWLCINLHPLSVQQGVTQRRVEKAEILEHTVLFLQNTGDGDRKKGEDGEKQHPFQDGFSGCLQRAAHFLGQEGEGLQLEAALNSTFSARLNSHACMNTEVPAKAHSSNSLPSTTCHQSSHLMKIQESHYRQQLCEVYRRHLSHAHRASLQHGDPKPPQLPHRHAAKEAQSQNLPDSQSVWRPWPWSSRGAWIGILNCKTTLISYELITRMPHSLLLRLLWC